ncbi:MAG: hypothetical protein AB7O24_17245 [Kofleriaceae bacterium]
MRAVAFALVIAIGIGRAHAEPWSDDSDDASELGEGDELAQPVLDPLAIGSPRAAPSIARVLAAAYAAAGLDRSPSRGWTRRARLASLAPWVSVRWGWDASWQDTEPDVDRGTVLDVRATWRLDRLVFDGRELQAASIEAARRRERAALSSRVIRSYFVWLRAGGGDARRTPGLPALEAHAILDDATGGWFSEELQRLRRVTSAGRTR